jgi:peptidoglycan/xylan/chitin deacetylase (PgdA/CDA1 family)
MRYLFLLCISFCYLLADAHILLYHRFNDDRYPSTSISNEELREQFTFLKNNNYTVVELDKIIEKLEKKEAIPDKWVAITIDDNYKSFYDNGYKIFKEFNYPFTIFVYVEATNGKYSDFMSWGKLKEVSGFGQIEYHSYAHLSMVKADKDKLKKDFEKGLKLFEENLGYKPKYFSYPYGEMNEYSKELIKEYNFRAIFNQNNNGAVSEKSDIFNIDRLVTTKTATLKSLLKQR